MMSWMQIMPPSPMQKRLAERMFTQFLDAGLILIVVGVRSVILNV